MTKRELVAQIAEKTGAAHKDAAKFYDAFIETVEETLLGGEKIQLSGFGNFDVKTKAAREGVNPATGAKIQIAASKKPIFRAAKQLVEKFNA